MLKKPNWCETDRMRNFSSKFLFAWESFLMFSRVNFTSCSGIRMFISFLSSLSSLFICKEINWNAYHLPFINSIHLAPSLLTSPTQHLVDDSRTPKIQNQTPNVNSMIQYWGKVVKLILRKMSVFAEFQAHSYLVVWKFNNSLNFSLYLDIIKRAQLHTFLSDIRLQF